MIRIKHFGWNMIQDGKSNNLHWVEERGGGLPHAAIKVHNVTQPCLQKIIICLLWKDRPWKKRRSSLCCKSQSCWRPLGRGWVSISHFHRNCHFYSFLIAFWLKLIWRETQSEDGICSFAVWRQGEYSRIYDGWYASGVLGCLIFFHNSYPDPDDIYFFCQLQCNLIFSILTLF